MPRRCNPPVSAKSLLQDLSAQIEQFLEFLEADLTPAILTATAIRGGPTTADLTPRGANSRIWISRVQEILSWSLLALEEEKWLQAQGLDRTSMGNRALGVWSIPSFLRALNLSHDYTTRNSLQQGRKLLRLEVRFGAGISLLMVLVMPSLRRLSRAEEAKVVTLLENESTGILSWAHKLHNLKIKYQALLPRPMPPNP